MSYCRHTGTDSDVYVIDSSFGGLTCFCTLETFVCGEDRAAMIAHLEEHRKCGDKVPNYALERLRAELAEQEKK